ncbi:hypothetical protein ZTR_09567 [Talaromyces verruculosus]|nr:hypothetical protein ZTR_09567 [Talaromyces verruculosus]
MNEISALLQTQLTPINVTLALLAFVGDLASVMSPYTFANRDKLCLYSIIWTIYSLFFHPLRSYPGPKLWALTRLAWVWASLRGEIAWTIRDYHEKYGPVIRIAPDELSYTTETAWKKIYGQRTPEFSKCLDGRGIVPPSRMGVRGIVTAHQEKHAQLRRAILPAFSERALREQEDYLQLYVHKLTKQLSKVSNAGPQNMAKWYSLTTFDIVNDLAFGEASGCLDNADNPWQEVLGARAKSIVWLQFTVYYGLYHWIAWIAPKYMLAAREKHMQLCSAKIKRRLQLKEDRRDFMSYIMNNTTENLSNLELVIMASAFIVAGSRTSAAALSGMTFQLLRNRSAYSTLVNEIRTAFQKEEDITMLSTGKLRYLGAVIDEGLRLYPPSPASLPRFVPGKGEHIDGKWIPGGIAVGVHQLSAGYMEWNFYQAKSFIPERWLDLPPDSPFANDKRSSIQPFSYGPRNCIGQGMAYAEMRLILAHVLWKFDLELVDNSDDWFQTQKTYLVWDIPPLMVNLRERFRS